MKRKFYPVVAGILLGVGCGGAQYTRVSHSGSATAEQVVYQSLEVFSRALPQCSAEANQLVRDNKDLVMSVVAQVKELMPQNDAVTLEKSKERMRIYANTVSPQPFGVDATQVQMMFQILSSPSFKKVVSQTADLMQQVADDELLMNAIKGFHGDLQAEPGERLAEILTLLSTDIDKRGALFGAVRTAFCNNLQEQDILDFLSSPEVLWILGPNLTVLLNSSIKKAQTVALGLQKLKIPKELAEFVKLIKELRPRQSGICFMDIEEYQKHFQLVASLLHVDTEHPTARPMRVLLNMLFKIYTMSKDDQCAGTSFDQIQKENIQYALSKLSSFLKDEQSGVTGFLQKIKPR